MTPFRHSKAVTQIPVRFPYQSYFDGALLERAILNQAPGSPIVVSTLQKSQTPGVGVALHPTSESPVAIRFRGGQADSAEVILTPGQRLNVGTFESFEWGLPFGWLGGGTSLLYVLHNPEAFVDFPASAPAPILFQRTRIQVGPVDGATPRINWPNAFPWDSAINGTDNNPQGGSGIVNVSPSYVMCRLRTVLAAPTTLSFYWQGTDDIDTLDDGITIDTNNVIEVDVSFPAVPLTSVLFPNPWPVAYFKEEISRFAGPFTMLTVEDNNPGSPLAGGASIDVVRYGVLG